MMATQMLCDLCETVIRHPDWVHVTIRTGETRAAVDFDLCKTCAPLEKPKSFIGLLLDKLRWWNAGQQWAR